MLNETPLLSPTSLPKLRETHRVGFGRLRQAAWLSETRLVLATANGLFAYDLTSGAYAPLLRRNVLHLSVSRDRARIAVAVEAPREILVLSAEDGRVSTKIHAHGGNIVHCLAFSPDGKLVASGGTDRALRLRRVDDGSEVRALTHPGGFTSLDGNPDTVAWSPDGARLATADNNGTVYLWLSSAGRLERQWKAGRWVAALQFSADGRQLVTAANPDGATATGKDRHLKVWSLDGTLTHDLFLPLDEGRVERQLALALSLDGTRLVSGGEDEHVHVLSTATWERERLLTRSQLVPDDEASTPGGPAPKAQLDVTGLELSPSGERLLVVTTPAAGHHDRRDVLAVQVWDLANATRSTCLTSFLATVAGLVPLAADEAFVIGAERGVRLYEPRRVTSRLVVDSRVNALAVAADGRTLAVGTASWEGEAFLFDCERVTQTQELAVVKTQVEAVAFSPDGTLVATAASHVRVWKPGRKSPVKKLEQDQVKAVAFSPDGRFLATAGWDGTLRLWSTPKIEAVRTLEGDAKGRFNTVAFSPLGLVAGAGYDGCVHVFRLDDGKKVVTLGRVDDRRILWSLAFSPDGMLLADGSWAEGEIRLWETATWSLVRRLSAHGDRISALAFSSDGRRLYSGSHDGTALVWAVSETSAPPTLL